MQTIQDKYTFDTTHALVVVTAKEHGKIYQLKAGQLSFVDYESEHPPSYSDNEGFFFQSTANGAPAGGNVREVNEEENIKRYTTAMAQELSHYIETYNPEVVLVIEPEHLKQQVAENVKVSTPIDIHTIKYGNHVEADESEIMEIVKEAFANDEDPTDPSSVAGEENAKEKRKILEIGKQVSG